MNRRSFFGSLLSLSLSPFVLNKKEEIRSPVLEPHIHGLHIPVSEIKARRFYIIDRTQIKAKEAIQKEEDRMIFDAINRCI